MKKLRMHINLPLQIMKTNHTGPVILSDYVSGSYSEIKVAAHSDHYSF